MKSLASDVSAACPERARTHLALGQACAPCGVSVGPPPTRYAPPPKPRPVRRRVRAVEVVEVEDAEGCGCVSTPLDAQKIFPTLEQRG